MSLMLNQGLVALTTRDELAEAVAPKQRKILFAFFQDDFAGGKIPYWHVVDPKSRSYMSTLSMQGLKDWSVI